MVRRSRARDVTLLLDADDTLWENNIHFIEVAEQFLIEVERYQIDRAAASALLSETERRNIEVHGYGSRCFALSVVEAFHALTPAPDAETADRLHGLACAISERDTLVLRPGAREMLARLVRTHTLILVTKGDRDEQERKVACSGLREYFDWVEIVAEKRVATYEDLVLRFDLDPRRTWMIGNSPRSDINPALAAGLNAILVPHPQTWEHEVEEIEHSSGRLLVMDSLWDVARFLVASL